MSVAEVLAWTPLAALLVTMPVFAARGRVRDPDVARRTTSVLLGHWLRDWMVWIIGPLERLLVRRRVSPDALNVLGAALGLLAGVAFAARVLPFAAWLIALEGISDILDGRVARARGIASDYGEFLDSTLDRFAETFTFAGVAWYLWGQAWMSAACVLAIGGSLLVSYTRARGEALGVRGVGGLAQRAERLVLLAFAALLDPVLTRWIGRPAGTVVAGAVVVIAVASVGTAIYRTVVIARVLGRRASGAPGRSPAEVRKEPETGAAARG